MTVHIPIPQVAVPDYWAGNRGRVADYLRLQRPRRQACARGPGIGCPGADDVTLE